MVRFTTAHRFIPGLAFVMLTTGFAWSAPTLTTDHGKLQTFLNHGAAPSVPTKGVIVVNSGPDLYMVDIAGAPLTLKKIASTGESGGALYRSFAISRDGRFVAIATGSNKNIYLFPVQENASKKLKIGEGTYPTFWYHPVTNATYVIYLDKTGLSTMMQEFDPVSLENKGTPTVLVKAVHWAKTELLDHAQQRYIIAGRLTLGATTYVDTVVHPNPLYYGTCKAYAGCEGKVTESDLPITAGRSADGRFVAGDDGLHGVLELADPLAVEDARIVNYYWLTSNTGYWDFKTWTVTCPQAATSRTQIDNRLAGYCNAFISPSARGQRFYGCVVHLGGGHTDLFVRQLPADPSTVQSVPHGPFDICQKGTVCLASDTILHITPCVDGSTFFNGPFWTQHKDFVVSKMGMKKSDGSWEAVLFDIAGAPSYKHLKLFSKTLSGSDYVQAWFEDRDATGSRSDRLSPVRTTPRQVRAIFSGATLRVIAPGQPDGIRAVVVTPSGKRIAGGSIVDGAAEIRLPSDTHTAGAFAIVLESARGATASTLTVEARSRGAR